MNTLEGFFPVLPKQDLDLIHASIKREFLNRETFQSNNCLERLASETFCMFLTKIINTEKLSRMVSVHRFDPIFSMYGITVQITDRQDDDRCLIIQYNYNSLRKDVQVLNCSPSTFKHKDIYVLKNSDYDGYAQAFSEIGDWEEVLHWKKDGSISEGDVVYRLEGIPQPE